MCNSIYTDGCYYPSQAQGEGGKASWNILITNDEGIIETRCGKLYGKLDSNRAELISIIRALEYSIEHFKEKYVIYTDYSPAIDYIDGKSKPKKNTDLFYRISMLYDRCRFRTKITKVKAHVETGDINEQMNNYVDVTAKLSANLFGI